MIQHVDPARLPSLDADRWAGVLAHVRGVLSDADPRLLDDEGRRLAALPVSRLSGGRGLRELSAYLAATPAVWEQVVAAIDDAGDLELLAPIGEDGAPVAGTTGSVGTAEDDLHVGSREADAHVATDADPVGGDASSATTDGGRLRDRERLRRVREQRDAATRRADGAEARAKRLGDEVAALRRRIDELERALAGATAELEAAARDRAQAVDRERRRRDAEVARLDEEISRLRRADDERRAAERHARERARARASETSTPDLVEAPRVIAGRPTQLPDNVHPNTREAADLLLDRDRLVLVDGYNVTLSHHGSVALEEQRSWLLQMVATAVARRGIRPAVIFDGERTGSATAPRGVQVLFTAEGVTADDEIVLWVEATDEPVVVVTDDRELTERVRASGADVLATGPFLWAIR